MAKEKNYDQFFKIRLKSSEKRLLYENAKKVGISGSEYIRQLIHGKTVKENIMTRIAIQDMTCEINAIGKNINQIVHSHNMLFFSEYDKKKLFSLMQDINKLLMELTEKVY